MRIIGGTHRGRTLVTPKNDAIRPTGDRVRESLFSILGDIDGVTAIDACAGTGALGCEALSRGADHVYFFDTAKSAIDIVKKNIEALGEESNATVRLGSPRDVTSAHLVFIDPPYADDLWAEILTQVQPLLADDALCVCEHPSRKTLQIPDGFEIEETRKYGETSLSFVRFIGE